MSPSLTGTAYRTSTAAVSEAATHADAWAAQQRRYAAADASISPERFVAPDLSSERARTAAARAGVNLSSRASIDSADRAWSARQAAQHRAATR